MLQYVINIEINIPEIDAEIMVILVNSSWYDYICAIIVRNIISKTQSILFLNVVIFI